MSRRPPVRLRDESGATAVEFALVVPVFLTIVAMIVVVALRMVYAGLAENEARSMARTASMRTSALSTSPYPDATAAARLTLCGNGALPIAGAAYSAATDCTFTDLKKGSTAAEGDIVKVTLTYRITAIDGLTSWLPAGITSSLDSVSATASVVRE